MYLDQFKEEFAPFYASGYFGSVHLPDTLSPTAIAEVMISSQDDAMAIAATEHSQIQRLFLGLIRAHSPDWRFRLYPNPVRPKVPSPYSDQVNSSLPTSYLLV